MKGRSPLKFVKWLDSHFEETLMIILGSLIGIIIMMQIIMRYFFHNALSWPEEFCRFCYIYFCFISIGFSVKNHCLLNITLLQDHLPRVVRMVLHILIQITMTIVFAVFFCGSIFCVQTTITSGQLSTAMQIPMTVPYLATSIGFFIAVLRSFQASIHSVKMLLDGEDIKVDVLDLVGDEVDETVKQLLHQNGGER